MSLLMYEDKSDLLDRELIVNTSSEEEICFTKENEAAVNEGDVSREKEKDFDRCPSRGPDEFNFCWKCQKVIIDLRA
jgi:hypothetical protein